MKYLIFIFILVSFQSFACDWSTIKKVNDGYLYSKACHIQVGKNIQKLKLQEQLITEQKKEIKLLNDRIALKDLALTKKDQQIQLWMTAAGNLRDKVNASAKLTTIGNAIYFTLGMLVTGGSVYLASRLNK